MDIVTLALALKKAKSYTDAAIAALPNGLVYKGEVNYYNLLPSNPEVGDCYTVKYKGTSGTTPDGSEYAWGNSGGTNTWIKLGSEDELFRCTYGTTTYAEISNAILQGKVPICFKNNKLYIYNFSSTLNIHFFVSFEIHSSGRTDTYQRLLRVDLSNTWITDDVQLENQTNKVYSISNNSTDFQYPSAAAVKNFVNEGVPYLTTAPIADNTSGKLKIVVLNSEPATKYNGYLYIITEGSDTYEYSVDNNVLSISNVAQDHISTTGTVMEIS